MPSQISQLVQLLNTPQASQSSLPYLGTQATGGYGGVGSPLLAALQPNVPFDMSTTGDEPTQAAGRYMMLGGRSYPLPRDMPNPNRFDRP